MSQWPGRPVSIVINMFDDRVGGDNVLPVMFGSKGKLSILMAWVDFYLDIMQPSLL